MVSILITGATGCTGSGILRYFKQHDNYHIFAMSRSKNGHDGHNVEYVYGNLTDKNSLRAIFRENEINAVFHVAGAVDPHINKKEFMKVNYQGTINLLEESINAGVEVFNFTSSVAVYGIKLPTNVSENFEPKPLGLYSQSKLMAEEKIIKESAEAGVKGGILRPPLILGNKDRHFYPRVKKLLKYNLFPIMGKPNHKIAIVHPYDIAQALELLTKAKKEIERYNIVSVHVGFKQLIEEFERQLYGKTRWKIRLPFALLYGATLVFEIVSKIIAPRKEPVFNREYATMIGKEWTFDTTKLEKIGYKPRMNFEQIIKDTISDTPLPVPIFQSQEILVSETKTH